MLCTPFADLLGAAAAFTIASDGDRDVEDVVAAASQLLEVEIRVLRILDAPDKSSVSGSRPVTYLVEVDAPPSVELTRWPTDPLVHHPNRASYAEPGGHQHDLDWAGATLRGQGISLAGRPVQVRT